jgi:SAM-dependent methyltransferase
MRRDELAYLRCPRCRGLLADGTGDRLACIACHASFPIEAGVPRLLPNDVDAAGLQHQVAALDADMRRHRWVVAKMSLATLTWIPSERVRLLKDIGIQPGQTVLDHCTGPGSNLPTLAAALGPTGTLVAMDLSELVVHQARALLRRRHIDADIHQADASALPYADETFDAVVHYGAINQFGERTRLAIDEIVRVTRPGGVVTLLDEGLVEKRRASWWGRMLIWGNPLFGARPPLHLLPEQITPTVRWVIRGMFYEIRFRKPR